MQTLARLVNRILYPRAASESEVRPVPASASHCCVCLWCQHGALHRITFCMAHDPVRIPDHKLHC